MYRPQWFPNSTGRDVPMTSRLGIERNSINKVFLTEPPTRTLPPIPVVFPIQHHLQKDPRWPEKLAPLVCKYKPVLAINPRKEKVRLPKIESTLEKTPEYFNTLSIVGNSGILKTTTQLR